MMVHPSVDEGALVLDTTCLLEENDKGAHYSTVACCYHVGKKGLNALFPLVQKKQEIQAFMSRLLI